MADTTMAPEWRQCKAFPDYEVSDTGLVRKAGTLRKLQFHPYGYTLVAITARPKQRKVYVHRLVAEAFLPDPTPGDEVDHINGDKTDNRKDNLRWLPRSVNRAIKARRGSLSARGLQEAGMLSSPTLDIVRGPATAEVVENIRRRLMQNQMLGGSFVGNNCLSQKI